MRDEWTIARGLTPHVLGLLWDRTLGRRLSDDDVPDAVDQLTPARLARLLGSAADALRIGNVDILDQHSGTTARARLALGDVVGPDAARMPPSIFAKLAPVDGATRLFGNLMHLGANEVRFYRDLRDDIPFDVPQVYAAEEAGRGGRFILLLEDLGADSSVDFRAGHPLSVDEARPVVEALALMQARFWQSERFQTDLAWLKRPTEIAHRAVERSVSALATEPCLRRFGSIMPEPMQRAARIVHERRDHLETLWGRGALTLAHGDPHLGNFYFRGDQPGFFDWQVCQIAQGTRDLTYFMLTSVSRDELASREPELIAWYREALVREGVSVAPFEELLEQVRLHVFYVLIAVVVTAASSTMQADAIARAAVENVAAAFLRLDPLAALERAG